MEEEGGSGRDPGGAGSSTQRKAHGLVAPTLPLLTLHLGILSCQPFSLANHQKFNMGGLGKPLECIHSHFIQHFTILLSLSDVK